MGEVVVKVAVWGVGLLLLGRAAEEWQGEGGRLFVADLEAILLTIDPCPGNLDYLSSIGILHGHQGLQLCDTKPMCKVLRIKVTTEVSNGANGKSEA